MCWQSIKQVHSTLNPLNAELHPICHLLALLGAYTILHVSRIRVNRAKTGYKTGVATDCEYPV